jgi:hypothetical protein
MVSAWPDGLQQRAWNWQMVTYHYAFPWKTIPNKLFFTRNLPHRILRIMMTGFLLLSLFAGSGRSGDGEQPTLVVVSVSKESTMCRLPTTQWEKNESATAET